MKHIFTILSLALVMTACKSTQEKTLNGQAMNLTESKATEFAEFEAWKQQKALVEAQKLVESSKETKPTIIYVSQPAAPTRRMTRRPAQTVQSAPVSQTVQTPVQQKKKWSNAAKGAVIGAGAGAVTGAVVAKNNRVLGAVIGAVAGGGAGFGIGKIIDKKQGR